MFLNGLEWGDLEMGDKVLYWVANGAGALAAGFALMMALGGM